MRMGQRQQDWGREAEVDRERDSRVETDGLYEGVLLYTIVHLLPSLPQAFPSRCRSMMQMQMPSPPTSQQTCNLTAAATMQPAAIPPTVE